jgi:serine/threonine-protein kinase
LSDTIGPYVVIRRLGAGGMGEVFLAEDPRLGRQVAIKRPTDAWLATPTARDRLRREARAAARLSHPNIAAIFDVLDDHDRPHIVMEFVEGETLAMLMMGGPISPSRTVEIGLQLADALAEAHANSIIHRDLKLGNVILTPNGRVKVLDFGLATSPDAGADRITDTGRVLGTPGYMAPEQMLGYSGDERSDIYSVGVMLFGLIAGRLPFDAVDSGGRTLTMLSKDQPPRADVVNPNVPAPAADLIARAMARDPDARFQSARDLHEALVRLQRVLAELPTGPSEVPTGDFATRRRRWRWVVAATTVVAIGATAFPFVRRRFATAPALMVLPATPVIAVLPFDVISRDPANAYLGVGFADSLTTELAHLPAVTVVRREELRDFVGSRRDPQRAAAAVGADVIVEASLQVEGSALRVNAKLYRADGQALREIDARSYEGSTDRLFDLQNQLAAGVIATASLGTLAANDKPGTSDPVAEQQYGQGRGFLDRADVPGNLKSAIDVLTLAVTRDPSFALAHAALAEAALAQYHDTQDTSYVTLALRESGKAIELDPTLSDVYVSRAKFYNETGKIDEAIQSARHAIDIQPTNDNAHELLGDLLLASRKSTAQRDEALAQFRDAIRLRPKFARHYDRLGVALLKIGRFDDAVAPLETVVRLQPDNADGWHKLGTAYQYKEDDERALAYYAKAIKLRPYPSTYMNMGDIQYDEGKFEDAAASFVEAVKLKGPYEATAHRNLGDAYVRLKRADEARSEYLASIGLLQANLEVNPTNADTLSLLAVCLAKVGRFAEAQARMGDALKVATTSQVLYRQATVLVLAGRPTDAIAALDRAIRSGYSVAVASKDYDLTSLHGLPGYQAIVQKRLP